MSQNTLNPKSRYLSLSLALSSAYSPPDPEPIIVRMGGGGGRQSLRRLFFYKDVLILVRYVRPVFLRSFVSSNNSVRTRIRTLLVRGLITLSEYTSSIIQRNNVPGMLYPARRSSSIHPGTSYDMYTSTHSVTLAGGGIPPVAIAIYQHPYTKRKSSSTKRILPGIMMYLVRYCFSHVYFYLWYYYVLIEKSRNSSSQFCGQFFPPAPLSLHFFWRHFCFSVSIRRVRTLILFRSLARHLCFFSLKCVFVFAAVWKSRLFLLFSLFAL